MKRVLVAVAACVALGAWGPSFAFSPKCALGLTQCTIIQGQRIPYDTAERIIDECRDFTRRNIGARVLKLSLADVNRISANSFLHPVSKAQLAYSWLHDSPLKFDRSLPYEYRYMTVRRACGEAFRDMRIAWPEDEE